MDDLQNHVGKIKPKTQTVEKGILAVPMIKDQQTLKEMKTQAFAMLL